MPRELFYQQISDSPFPLAPSDFDFTVLLGDVQQPDDLPDLTYLRPLGTLQVLDTPPAVVPDPTWYVETAEPPPPADDAISYEFLAAQIVEEDFELPPESPELAWAPRFDQPVEEAPDLPDQNEFLVNEALYGTIDYHPGYWYVGDHQLPDEPVDDTHLQPLGDVPFEPSLFVDPLPLQQDWQTTFDQPDDRDDAPDLLTETTNTLFPGSYQRLYADSLRYYLSGADSDGGDQSDPSASLGGYRSATEAEHGARIQLGGVTGVTVDYASRANGDAGEIGTLTAASSNSVSYAAPGGSLGRAVRLEPGATATVADGTDGSRYVRVTRTSDDPLLGVASLEFHDQYSNVISMADADNAESTGGGDRYRAVILRCVSFASVESIRLYLRTLGDSAVCGGGGLPSSGAGTIGVTADGLCSWPHQGWARIETAGGSLREIVYYASRTNNQLVVPSLGRARLGSTASLGAADDRVYPVPGARIAWEPAGSGGDVQTIADESTAPTGLSWSTAITPAGGVNAGRLLTGQNGALWIHREIPAGAAAFSEHHLQVAVRYEVESETYTETLGGLYRIAVEASRRLELRIGVDAPPDPGGEPDETLAVPIGTTPENHLADNPWTTTAELVDDAVNYVSVNFRNEYGLASEATVTQVLPLSGGEASQPPPSAPVLQSVDAAAGGKVRIRAAYYYLADDAAQRGDQWLLYVRDDGTDPDPSVDSPVTVSLADAGGLSLLDHTTVATYSAGATVRALVRLRRTADGVDSASSAVLGTIAVATGPSQVAGGLYYRRQARG